MKTSKRRFLLSMLGVCSAFAPARIAGSATKMQIVGIGPWEFKVPVDWMAKKNDGHAYLESSDGKIGCYLKALAFEGSGKSVQKIANYVQTIHEQSFRNAANGNWKVMSQTNQSDGPDFRSRLDMYDQARQYRILSLVLASPDRALQITIHNYLCEDYLKDRDAYDEISSSLRHAKKT